MPVILAIPGPTVRTRTIAEFSVREFSADRPAPTRTEAAVSRRSALGHWHGHGPKAGKGTVGRPELSRGLGISNSENRIIVFGLQVGRVKFAFA